MANSYFRFKKFLVEQDRCGMKVSTDACILGAYTSYSAAKSILDIGTGTGLLSLMLAQRHESAKIDAVENEPLAFEQARTNFLKSPWADRIMVHHSSIQKFNPSGQYDLIICNPPFYPRHQQSKDPQRRQAFHQNSLSFPELARSFGTLLSSNGHASILLPLRQAEEFSLEAKKMKLFCRKELLIADKLSVTPHRCIRIFSFTEEKNPLQEKLFIRSEDETYSPGFRQLLRDYYLIF